VTARSKLPAWPGLDTAQTQYLDTLGKVKEATGQLEDLDSAATLVQAVAKINEILAAHRTK
jgi:hypothetical protein